MSTSTIDPTHAVLMIVASQWNTAFGTPQAAPLPPAPTALRIPVQYSSPTTDQTAHDPRPHIHASNELPAPETPVDTMQAAFGSIPSLASLGSVTHSQRTASRPPMHTFGSSGSGTGVGAASLTPTFVSPSMWQSSVAAVYEDGLKRRWDFDGSGEGGSGKRMR